MKNIHKKPLKKLKYFWMTKPLQQSNLIVIFFININNLWDNFIWIYRKSSNLGTSILCSHKHQQNTCSEKWQPQGNLLFPRFEVCQVFHINQLTRSSHSMAIITYFHAFRYYFLSINSVCKKWCVDIILFSYSRSIAIGQPEAPAENFPGGGKDEYIHII